MKEVVIMREINKDNYEETYKTYRRYGTITYRKDFLKDNLTIIFIKLENKEAMFYLQHGEIIKAMEWES